VHSLTLLLEAFRSLVYSNERKRHHKAELEAFSLNKGGAFEKSLFRFCINIRHPECQLSSVLPSQTITYDLQIDECEFGERQGISAFLTYIFAG